MTDFEGNGWWRASDGNWYPPELHPNANKRGARVAPEAVQRLAAEPTVTLKKGSPRKVVVWSIGIIGGLSLLGNLVPGEEPSADRQSLATSSSETIAGDAQPPAATEEASREAAEPTPSTTDAPKATTTILPTTTAPPRTTTTVDAGALRRLDMQSWVSENSSMIDEITDVLGDVTVAASEYDIFGLSSACVDLRGTVMDAQRLRPIPEPSVNDPWQKALAAYKRSAEACITGAENVDAAMLTRSATYTNEATRYLQDATAAMGDWMAKNGF